MMLLDIALRFYALCVLIELLFGSLQLLRIGARFVDAKVGLILGFQQGFETMKA